MYFCPVVYLSLVLGAGPAPPAGPASLASAGSSSQAASPGATGQPATVSLPGRTALPDGGRGSAAPGNVLPVSPQEPPLPEHSLVHFDPLQAELRWQAGSWQLWSGEVLLKDFGTHLAEARQALYLVRLLHWTEHGTLGTPRPILEYWLSNGQAPQGSGVGQLLPLDQATLRVEMLQGQWWVRDAQRLLFNFGVQQEEAQKALALLRHYGFTHVGYVGWPQPLLIYFLRQPGMTRPPVPRPAAAPPVSPALPPRSARRPSSPVFAGRWPLASHQLAPPEPAAQTTVRFDPWRLRIQSNGDHWQLVSGSHVLAHFRTPQDAQSALAAVQFYHFTEQVYLGNPGQSFSFFLVHGQAPRGLRPGLFGLALTPETVTVQQVGDHWLVFAGPQPLEDFGSRRAEAAQLVQAIQHYRFDYFYRIGPVGPDSLTFLVQSH